MMIKRLFLLIVLGLITSTTYAQNPVPKFALEGSVGLNFAKFQSFPQELSNNAKPGHSLTLGASVYRRWGVTAGVTLRHYKNELTLPNLMEPEAMSVDLINFHLVGEAPIFVVSSVRLAAFTGMGMDYNFLIKAAESDLSSMNFEKTMLTSIVGLKFQVARFFLIGQTEFGWKSFMENKGEHTSLYEFRLGFQIF
jgi:hypothetical protein